MVSQEARRPGATPEGPRPSSRTSLHRNRGPSTTTPTKLTHRSARHRADVQVPHLPARTELVLVHGRHKSQMLDNVPRDAHADLYRVKN